MRIILVPGADRPECAKVPLEAHKDAGSDLLVMGACSRSRLRQRIFGGVSDYVIFKANTPVLTLHT